MTKTRLVDLPVERPVRIYQGSSSSPGPGYVEECQGFRIRTRGAPTAKAHEFECPTHGRFTAITWTTAPQLCAECGQASHWAPSVVGIGKAAGEVEC